MFQAQKVRLKRSEAQSSTLKHIRAMSIGRYIPGEILRDNLENYADFDASHIQQPPGYTVVELLDDASRQRWRSTCLKYFVGIPWRPPAPPPPPVEYLFSPSVLVMTYL